MQAKVVKNVLNKYCKFEPMSLCEIGMIMDTPWQRQTEKSGWYALKNGAIRSSKFVNFDAKKCRIKVLWQEGFTALFPGVRARVLVFDHRDLLPPV